MAKMRKQFQADDPCSVATAQYLIAGKWKMLILFHLRQDPKRFNELQRLLSHKIGNPISQAILTSQLRELENDGLVHREIYKEVPPRVEYSLTDIGRTFIPVLNTLGQWGKIYQSMREQSKPKANPAWKVNELS
jgi:Predicted transcriptional regulators